MFINKKNVANINNISNKLVKLAANILFCLSTLSLPSQATKLQTTELVNLPDEIICAILDSSKRIKNVYSTCKRLANLRKGKLKAPTLKTPKDLDMFNRMKEECPNIKEVFSDVVISRKHFSKYANPGFLTIVEVEKFLPSNTQITSLWFQPMVANNCFSKLTNLKYLRVNFCRNSNKSRFNDDLVINEAHWDAQVKMIYGYDWYICTMNTLSTDEHILNTNLSKKYNLTMLTELEHLDLKLNGFIDSRYSINNTFSIFGSFPKLKKLKLTLSSSHLRFAVNLPKSLEQLTIIESSCDFNSIINDQDFIDSIKSLDKLISFKLIYYYYIKDPKIDKGNDWIQLEPITQKLKGLLPNVANIELSYEPIII